jgi:hypothetical protein
MMKKSTRRCNVKRKCSLGSKDARSKALQKQCLTTITTELEALKANNEGKIPYGGIARIVAEYKENFPWINEDMIKNHLRKLSKCNDLNEVITTTMEAVGLVCNYSNTTTLTASRQSNESTTMIDDTTPVLDDTTIPFDDILDETTQKRPGRPKGTTKEQSQDLQQKIKLAPEEAADKYSESRKRARSRNTRLKKESLPPSSTNAKKSTLFLITLLLTLNAFIPG